MSGEDAKLDVFEDFGASVEGEMTVPNQQKSQQHGKPEFNTLDEPIRDTVVGGIDQLAALANMMDVADFHKFITCPGYLQPLSMIIRVQLRDVKAVGVKFFHVLYPKEKKSLLKEWDLWGPLVLCTFMAMVLRGSSGSSDDSANDGGPEVAEVFVIVWIGSMVVTLNSKLLGGNM
ncbi:Protein YIPF [Gryllus bimaculatus]|nr:Protein YIPF [Gryllus bimaculatus]